MSRARPIFRHFNLADGLAYPGDSYAAVQAVAGNKVMAAWLSRYCEGGSPLYTLVSELDDITAYAGELQTAYELPDLYVLDLWGVAGSQKSVDYTLQGFPEVGEIPFGCVWTARGTLMLDAETSTFDIVWTKAERLTSGMRDPNRLEVDAIEGAGFVVTWQEDPEGLRPGQGLGPGEGWSGAIVNAKTDVWYSYLDYDHFNLVVDTDLDPLTVDAATPVELFDGDTQPKPAVPMSMPVRLTDNNMCKPTKSLPYCYFDFDVDFDVATGTLPTEPTPASDFCASTVDWTTPADVTMPICVTEDLRSLNGRVGASRPRINLQAFELER